MKHLLTTFVFVFTLVFSSTSHAKWTEIAASQEHTFYVDFERIRKNGGYLFFWRLRSSVKPDKWGDMSAKVYYQADCVAFRMKKLSASYHTQPMGNGRPSTLDEKPSGEWTYPPPNSFNEVILNSVCNR